MRRSSRGDYQVCSNKFSIDIGTSDTERMQLEVLLSLPEVLLVVIYDDFTDFADQ